MPFAKSKSAPPTQLLSAAPAAPVIRRELPNHLTLLIQRDPSHPLVAFHAVIRTGSATEGPFLGTGISHVLEHMLFKGTPRRGVGVVEKEARSYGGTSQGFTTYDTTSYQLIVNKEFWSQAADLLVDALFFPTMDSEEFVKERDVVLRELRLGIDDPSHRAWELLFENAYRAHPYRVPIIGYEPLLMKLTREDLIAYHRQHYQPNAMVIAVVGDIDPEKVTERMITLTRSIPPGIVPAISLPQEPAVVSPREVTEEAPSLAHTVISLGFPGISLQDEDLCALDLLSWLLGGGRGSRLERALKETGLVHAVQCVNYTPFMKGLFVATLRLDGEKVPAALDVFWKECERLQDEPLSPAEVEEGKRCFLREYLASRQTVAGMASDLATNEMALGDPTFTARYMEGILRVTPSDLQRVARAILQAQRVTRVTLIPAGSRLPEEGKSTEGVPAASTERQTLENGLRLLLREDHRFPLVNLQLSFLGGVRFETAQTNGLSSLTSRMLLRGTRRKSAQEVTDSLRRMGGQLEAASGRNSLGLSLEVTRPQLSEALTLLGEIVLEPAFSAQELEGQRRLALAGLAAKEEDPFAWGMKRLMAAFFTQHPYRLDPAGEAEVLSRLKREDLLAFYQRLRDPKQMVLSIVGDFHKEEILPLLSRSFGSFSASGEEPLHISQEPPLLNLREHEEETPRGEALIMIAFPGLSLSDPRVASLDLLEMILSGGAGRLFTEVREKQGLAYTVGAFGLHGIEPGAFILYAVTDPSKLSRVRQTLFSEVQRLQDESIPREELEAAKQGLIGSRRIARQTLAGVAAQITLDELYGLGYDFSDRYETQVKGISPQDLQQVARELLRPERCVVVVGVPSRGQILSPREESSERVPLSVGE